MRVIPPLAITTARLTSTNAPEPGVGEAAYVAATAYGVGDRVIVGGPTSAATITIAAPAVVTWTAHGQPEGTPVVFTTTGALPTGLVAGATYYVLRPTADAFNLSATVNGGPIVTTGSQSGTHTASTFIHRTYESLAAANTGNYPPLDVLTSAPKWLDIGPTNRWAMFDLLRSTATTVASPLTVVITPGQRVDSIGLVGLVAETVTVSVSSGGSPVYSRTINLSRREVVSWSDYFFAPFDFSNSVALFDLPPFSDGVITVTMSRSTGMVSCGSLILGTSIYLGTTQYEAETDALNFSRIDRLFDGTAVLVQRRSVPRTVQRVWCDKTNVNKVRAAREALNAIPAFWSGIDDSDSPYFEAVQILGIYKAFGINLAGPEHAVISLELEEV